MKTTFKHVAVFAATMILGAVSGALSHAQEIEEIIVIAQKREQNLQEIPISISAFGGEAMRDLGWLSSEDVADQTPGLIATSFSGDSTVSTFSIRGVGQNDFADHQEAPTAIYVDGVYVGFTGAAGIQMYDLERVEVLRGPQGTLFGRNATGGLVHLISKRPTDSFEAYTDLTVGDFNQFRVEGAISGPLSDTVRGRLSILSDRADGYFKNYAGTDARQRDFLNARGQLAFSPSEAFDGLLTVWTSRTNDIVAGAYDFRPAFEAIGDMDADFQGSTDDAPGANDGYLNPLGSSDKDAGDVALTLNYDTGKFVVTSITEFGEFEKFYEEDSDGNTSRTIDYIATQNASQFSQELRISGDTGRASWVAGIYYLNLDGDYFTDLNAPTFGGAVEQTYDLETKSWSAFAHSEFRLTNSTSLTAGLRWINDEKEYNLLSVCVPSDTLPPNEPFLPGFPDNDCALFTSGDPANPLVVEAGQLNLERDDSDYAGVISLTHRVSEDAMFYGSLNRGMKGGGFTAPLDGFLTPPEIIYDPEILTSYEAGTKLVLADSRISLNASAFYYDYKDYQAYVFQGLTSQVRNQDAEITGGEIELDLRPADGFQLKLGIALLDATVKDVELSPGNFAEQDMILAPELTVNALAKKTWDVGDSGQFMVQIDGLYVDKQQYNTTNSIITEGDAYTVWNARIGFSKLHGENEWDLSVFANNLTDEEYTTYQFDLAAFFGYSLQVYAPPRWVGAQFRYRWR